MLMAALLGLVWSRSARSPVGVVVGGVVVVVVVGSVVVVQGPVEMTRFTGVPGGAIVPAAGLCEETVPLGWVGELRTGGGLAAHGQVVAAAACSPAAAGENPTTLGTVVKVWVPDTVSLTTLCRA